MKVFGITIIILGTALFVWQRFSHPDMTDIRWFMEFWYYWLEWIAVLFIGLFIAETAK
jgi:hypothetical protein